MKRRLRYTSLLHIGGALLLAGLLGACAGHTPSPAQRDAAMHPAPGSAEQRLQALESRVDRLTQRVDQLQAAPGRTQAGTSWSPPLVELQPIRPRLGLSPQATRPGRKHLPPP